MTTIRIVTTTEAFLYLAQAILRVVVLATAGTDKLHALMTGSQGSRCSIKYDTLLKVLNFMYSPGVPNF